MRNIKNPHLAGLDAIEVRYTFLRRRLSINNPERSSGIVAGTGTVVGSGSGAIIESIIEAKARSPSSVCAAAVG